jgi:hypothetical protein
MHLHSNCPSIEFVTCGSDCNWNELRPSNAHTYHYELTCPSRVSAAGLGAHCMVSASGPICKPGSAPVTRHRQSTSPSLLTADMLCCSSFSAGA